MVVANRFQSHANLAAVRTPAPVVQRERAKLELIQTRVPGAENLTRPSSDDGFALFEMWEATQGDFAAWEIFPIGFPEPAHYVVLEHAEPYQWFRVEDCARLLSLFQRSSALHVSFPYRGNDDIFRLSLGRERMPAKFGVSYSLPRDEEHADELCETAKRIVEAWKVDDLITLQPTKYRDRDGFLFAGSQEITILCFEYPRASEPWFPVTGGVYAFDSERAPLEKLGQAMQTIAAAPEDLRVVGQVELADYDRAAGRLFEVQPTWNMSWTGRYKTGFNPLARPKDVPQSLRYPLLVSKGEGNSLALQLDIIHAPEGSFLDFQSAKGFDYLAGLLGALKMPCERWEGPFASRWNLAEQNQRGQDSLIQRSTTNNES